MKPSQAMTDKLISLDGSKDHVMSLAREVGENSLSLFSGLLAPEEIEEIIEGASREVDVTSKMQPFYASSMDGDDVLNLIAFYKSPTGKKLMKARHELTYGFVSTSYLVANEVATKCVKEALRKLADKEGDV